MIDFQKLECHCLSGTPENPCWTFHLVCTRIRLNQDFQDTCVGVFFLGWLSTLAKRRSFSRPQTMMGKEGRRKMILKCFLFWGSDLGRGPIFRGELAGLNRWLFKAERIRVCQTEAGGFRPRGWGRLEKKCTSKPCLETQGAECCRVIWCTDRSCLRFYLTWGR